MAIPAPLSQRGFLTHFPYGYAQGVTQLTGIADAIPLRGGTYFVGTGAPDLMTLAVPTSGAPLENFLENGNGMDGMTITVIDVGGHAHTITVASLNGHLTTVTFNGTQGSNVTLEALLGVWYVIAANGVTLS